MALNGFPDHCYFVRRTPLKELTSELHTQFNNTPWAVALQADLDENGMAAPLVVDNTHGNFKVRVGTNRVMAVRNLGWTHVPCIIFGGSIPSEWARVVIKHEGHCREYIPDGRLEVKFEKLMVRDAHLPESMKYPPNTDPYHAIKE